MRFCRFVPRDQSAALSAISRFGIIEGETVREITAAPWSSWQRASHTFPLPSVRLCAPVEPRKIVCVGRNYAAHAAELGNELPKEPLIFLKPSSAVIGPDDRIILTKYSQRVEHEGELALVVGRRCSHLDDHEDPLSYLAGYSCLNDVTARDLQKADVQFTRAKGFDTFCPVGPWIESQLDPSDLVIETHVNSSVRQSARTSLMIFSPAFLVRWISRMMTLDPGDVIATGTPAGVGPLAAGDSVEVCIDGIGVLRNPVHAPRA
ncbi:MAG TPA: fumarylacetoacetate hydrolase family protein [Terriglobales bacterium]|nr:fumarylacetoacetate hydrolase family protein [Terriglobales bacterium]